LPAGAEPEAARAKALADLAQLYASQGDDADVAAAVYAAAKGVYSTLRGRPEAAAARLAVFEAAYKAALVIDSASRIARAALWLAPERRRGGRGGQNRVMLESAFDGLKERHGYRAILAYELAMQALAERAREDALLYLDAAEAELLEGQAGHHAVTHSIPGMRGQIFLEMGLLDQAAKAFRDERERVDALPLTGGALLAARFDVILHGSNLNLAAERFDLARQTLEAGLADLPMILAIPDAAGALRVRLALALSELEREDLARPRLARRTYQDVLVDGVASDQDRLSANLRLAHLELRAGELAPAREHLAVARAILDARLGGGAVIEEAFHCSLEARLAREEGGDVASLHVRLAALYDDYLSEWSSESRRAGGLGFLQFDAVDIVLSELVHLTVLLEPGEVGIERALDHVVRAQSLGTLARAVGAAHVSLSQIRELLAPGEGLLVYLPGTDMSHVFALDQEVLLHERIADGDSLRRRRKDLLREVLRSPQPLAPKEREARIAALDSAATDLGGMLLPEALAPWLERTPALTIVGIDLIGYLPFECLRTRDGEWLGMQKAIGYLPGLPFGVALERGTLDPLTHEWARDLLVVADTELGESVREGWPHLAPLAFESHHEELLTGRIPRERTEFLRADRATRTELEVALQGTVRILQFVTHGVHDRSREISAGLVLTDGLLWSQHAASLNAPPLVILMACGTARGRMRRGDPSIGHLGGAFFRAGTRTVVLAFAELAYEPSLQLSGHFMESLSTGRTTAAALLDARRSLAADERWNDPYYTSLVHVQGLAHHAVLPPLEAKQTGTMWYALAALIVGAVLLEFRARRKGA
jgi:hypothetical protein